MTVSRGTIARETTPVIAAVIIALVAFGGLVMAAVPRPVEQLAQRVVATPEPVEATDEEVSDSSSGGEPKADSNAEVLPEPEPGDTCPPPPARTWYVTPHMIQAEVAVRVPGFGGAWVEGEALRVWLTEPSREAAERARQELVTVNAEWSEGASDGQHYNREEIVILQADYSYDCLYGWDLELTDLLNLPGAGYSTIRVQSNRIVFGFEDPDRVEADVRDFMRAKGVPEGAVLLEQGGPIVPEMIRRS